MWGGLCGEERPRNCAYWEREGTLALLTGLAIYDSTARKFRRNFSRVKVEGGLRLIQKAAWGTHSQELT